MQHTLYHICNLLYAIFTIKFLLHCILTFSSTEKCRRCFIKTVTEYAKNMNCNRNTATQLCALDCERKPKICFQSWWLELKSFCRLTFVSTSVCRALQETFKKRETLALSEIVLWFIQCDCARWLERLCPRDVIGIPILERSK